MQANKKEWKRKSLKKTLQALDESLVIVEGKRDERALQEIGVRAKIIRAAGSPERVVSRARNEARASSALVALLFDFDEEGTRKTRFFEEAFLSEGIRVDSLLRKRVKQLFRVNTIEDLPFQYRKLLEELEESD